MKLTSGATIFECCLDVPCNKFECDFVVCVALFEG